MWRPFELGFVVLLEHLDQFNSFRQ